MTQIGYEYGIHVGWKMKRGELGEDGRIKATGVECFA